jgi:hypothetical protein
MTLGAAVLVVALVGEPADVEPAPPAPPAPSPAATAAPAPPPPPPPPANVVVPVLHGTALMVVMRGVETVIWPIPFAQPEHFAAHYEEAYTRPPKFDTSQPFMRWDGDPWFINVVGHGLFGSELYVRARQCRLGWAGSLAFAAAASTTWEYVFEANGVRPSALDLVYTPLMGLALGEARYAVHRAAAGLRSPGARAVVRAVVDPLGEIERALGTEC